MMTLLAWSDVGSRRVNYSAKKGGVDCSPLWEHKAIAVARVTANYHMSDKNMEVE